MAATNAAAKAVFGTTVDPEKNAHHRSIIPQLQAMLDSGNTHSFNFERRIIRACSAFDGCSVHRRSFMVEGVFFPGAENSKKYWFTLLLYEGSDNNQNFRHHSSPYFADWDDVLQHGWTDRSGRIWSIDVTFIADGKGIHQAYWARDHKGRCTYLRYKPDLNVSLHAGCAMWCGGTGLCRHIHRLEIPKADRLLETRPLHGYAGHPYLLLELREGVGASTAAEIKARLLTMETHDITDPSADHSARVLVNKLSPRHRGVKYADFIRLYDVVLEKEPEGGAQYIETARKDAMIVMLRQRFPKDYVDGLSNRSITDVRTVLRAVLQWEQLEDRCFGLPTPPRYDDEGKWVGGSLLRDPLKVVANTLHIMIRISEHLINVLVTETIGDGTKLKDEQTRLANNFAKEVKVCVSTPEMLATSSPIGLDIKESGRVNVTVSLNGGDDKRIFCFDETNETLHRIIDTLLPEEREVDTSDLFLGTLTD
jgi:hypothetical protein